MRRNRWMIERRSAIKTRSYLNIFGPALAAAVLAGCSGSGSGGGVSSASPSGPARTVILAIDTSASAKNHHEMMFNRAIQTIAQLPMETRLVIYRFDASPAEFHDGKPMVDEAEAGMKLKDEFTWSTSTKGTDLAGLIRQIDAKLPELPKPIALDIYTDCGSELMTPEDDEYVKRTVARWADVDVKFIGVQSGHRERLYKMFRPTAIRIE